MSSSSRRNSAPKRAPLAAGTAESGFTLLEVMISMFIIVFIGIAIYQMVTKTFELRDVLSNEGDFYNGIRLSMQIVQRDVALMYSPVLILPDYPKQPGQTGQPTSPELAGPQTPQSQQQALQDAQDLAAGDNGQTFQFWGPMLDKTGIRPMHFIGTEDKMSFVAVSNVRIYRDSPESEFVKVAYELVKDEDESAPEGTSILVKTASPNVWEEDERRDKLRKTYAVLRGVKKLKFRYWRKDKGKDGYTSSWDSDKEDQKNVYPDLIEVSVEVHGPSKLVFEGIYSFRPEVPLSGIPGTG
jgi:prepilin-type N-terminal cleavage/methylation domain-containing protein